MVEGVASFLLVFWSAVAALMQEMHGTLTFPMVCLVVALTVGFVLCWLGPAHFNPAVTLTFTVFGYLSWAKVRTVHPCIDRRRLIYSRQRTYLL
jgi:aquaporin NIP